MTEGIPPEGARVGLITRELNSYRIPFLNAARSLLESEGVLLEVYVGGATEADRSKGDLATLDWCKPLPAKELTVFGKTAWWQPALRMARDHDLLITEQATKQLSNVPLSVMQRMGLTRHCLWGHGKNFQQSIEGSAGEGLKQWFTRNAHWFFSYTDASTSALSALGFPLERVTTFNNSTDVEGVRRIRQISDKTTVAATRMRLGLEPGPTVGYLGALYAPKRTTFLLESLLDLRKRMPDMSAIVIGGGSDQDQVAEFADSHEWVHHAGPTYGPERVELALCCDLLLMPGLLGLNVVDGFALGLPTVTTDIDYHSPEISYVIHGQNGWICERDATPATFASQVADILKDKAFLKKLQDGAESSGTRLGTTAMAEKFSAGVLDALSAPARSDDPQ